MSDFNRGLSVRFKSNTKKTVNIMIIFFILLCSIATMVCLREIIFNFTLLGVLVLLCSILPGIYFIVILLSLNYSITLNSKDFSYKQIFFKGTVSYADVKQLYIIKTPGKRKDFYRLKVRLGTGRALNFSLSCLQKQESELMKKIFRVKSKKSYIYKSSIY